MYENSRYFESLPAECGSVQKHKDELVADTIVYKSNFKQRMKLFVNGDSTKFGCVYYRKIITEEKRKSLVDNNPKPPAEWQENVDFSVVQIPTFKQLIVVKKSMVDELVKKSHLDSCHGGRNVMRYALKDFYIEKKEAIINQHRVCKDCDAVKSLPEDLPFVPIESKYPGERLQFDFTFFKESTIFTLIDHFTKYAFAYITKSRKSNIVIELITNSIEKLKKGWGLGNLEEKTPTLTMALRSKKEQGTGKAKKKKKKKGLLSKFWAISLIIKFIK